MQAPVRGCSAAKERLAERVAAVLREVLADTSVDFSL